MKYECEIKNILAQVMELSSEEIVLDENTLLVGGIDENSLGISSMDYVEFLVGVENVFQIVFDFSTRINTIGELIDYIDYANGL